MKIADKFFWPGMSADIRDFCRFCDVCQRMTPIGRPVPLHPLHIITEPFSRVAIDQVGPLPPSSEGHRYVLTLIDTVIGFPEVVPLRKLTPSLRPRLSFPSSNGLASPVKYCPTKAQFTSQLMAELHKLLGVKPSFTTPFIPAHTAALSGFKGP